MKCPFHGKNPKPNVCHRCARGPRPVPELKISDEGGGTKRVISTCRDTGKERISFRITGNLTVKGRTFDGM